MIIQLAFSQSSAARETHMHKWAFLLLVLDNNFVLIFEVTSDMWWSKTPSTSSHLSSIPGRDAVSASHRHLPIGDETWEVVIRKSENSERKDTADKDRAIQHWPRKSGPTRRSWSWLVGYWLRRMVGSIPHIPISTQNATLTRCTMVLLSRGPRIYARYVFTFLFPLCDIVMCHVWRSENRKINVQLSGVFILGHRVSCDDIWQVVEYAR